MFSAYLDDRDGRRGDTTQALAQWQHLVASSEALIVLHRAIHPASYHCIRMAIKIASDLPAFSVVIGVAVCKNRRYYGQCKIYISYIIVLTFVIDLIV